MPLVKYNAVSRTAARALEEFSDAFRGALTLGDPDLWAARHGFVLVTRALKTTFPIPLDAVGYHEFKGDMKYRGLYNRALSMKSKKWQDGVKEKADIVEAPDFIDWAGQPAKMAREWLRLPNTLVAQMLEANPNLDLYKDPDSGVVVSRALFANDHPNNVLIGSGTFDNERDTTQADIRSGKFFEDADEYYASVKGPNQQPLGLTLTGGCVITSIKRNNIVRKALANEMLITAVSNAGVPDATSNVVAVGQQKNLWQNAIQHEVAKELTSSSDDYIYTIAGGNAEAYPWVVMQGDSPEEFVHDKSSEMYKSSLDVAYSSVGDANVAAALPHKIVRWHITA